MAKRLDSIGFFWNDINEKNEKKKAYLIENGWVEYLEKWYKDGRNPDVDYKAKRMSLQQAYKEARATGEKCEPPEPFWLKPNYLPHLSVAKSYTYDLITDEELNKATLTNEPFAFDIECYSNYFLIAFKSLLSGKVIYFESVISNFSPQQLWKLKWVMENLLLISFNGNYYDMPLAALALNGFSCADLKEASDEIIVEGVRGYQLLTRYNVKPLKSNHIDIKEVAPISGSLKIYGGRVHTKRMQDLPFAPETRLDADQINITRWYCINDLDTTLDLTRELEKELNLRAKMTQTYGIDLRSKSDAQIAEAIIASEVKKLKGVRHLQKNKNIQAGYKFKYKPQKFLYYQSELLNWVYDQIKETDFYVGDKLKTKARNFNHLDFEIAGRKYRVGVGGLHSQESKITHYSSDEYELEEFDVTSYYPFVILTQKLMPTNLGVDFLRVYKKIVDMRIQAKRAGNKSVADSLKIVINGSFGKFGSFYSLLYSPELMIQTTITGQLSLLMLIERLELAGINVVSANTDGIVTRIHKSKKETAKRIVTQWEKDVNFQLEQTSYKSIHNRDVNNYIAVQTNGEAKKKGIFGEPGLKKNPTCTICAEAVSAYLSHGDDIATYIKASTNINKFVAVRTVKGGAVKDNEYLGKAIRWYYSNTTDGTIIYAQTGNKVPKSEGAKPLMLLPDHLPEDIDHNWYIEEAYQMMRDIGM